MSSAVGLPILATIPRSGTWFLRYAISFLCHLDRGGRVDDRLTGRTVGDPSGRPFDFARFKGGPLFRVRGTFPLDHLFIGHTVCPGFAKLTGLPRWWAKTEFHAPGYDYLHANLNYGFTPVELAPYDYAPIRVAALERSAGTGRGHPVALIFRNPLDQASSYQAFCQGHPDPGFSRFRGRPLAQVSFRDFLFGGALASYAKQFISFQMMASRYPARVRLFPYERLVDNPSATLAELLDFLSGRRQQRPMLDDAVWLARSQHLRAVERELGRALGDRREGSHMREESGGLTDDAMRDEAVALLQDMGIDTSMFVWTCDSQAARSAA